MGQQIWVVFLHAREIDSDPPICHTLVELVSHSQEKVEEFAKGKATQHIVTLEGVECLAHRAIHPAILE